MRKTIIITALALLTAKASAESPSAGAMKNNTYSQINTQQSMSNYVQPGPQQGFLLPTLEPTIQSSRTLKTLDMVDKLRQNFSFSYYLNILGPSMTLPQDETYNVFVEGRAPLQMFHAANLRYQINQDWAVGGTLSGINHFTEKVKNPNGIVNDNEREMFNARVYVSLPAITTSIGTLFHTAAVELPTSQVAADDELKYGLVLSQSFAFKLPYNSRWSVGISSQIISYQYENNVKPAPCQWCYDVPLQTTIVSTGPYVNYSLSDKWQIATQMVFDWDQRGKEANTSEFNNNLPDRWRAGVNWLPGIKPISSIGLYTQGLIKYTAETQVIGADFGVRF